MKKYSILLLAIFLIADLYPQTNHASLGPKNGTLVIVGGGGSEDIFNIFINAAGGKDAPIVCIPSADGRNEDEMFSINAKYMMDLGATNVTVLHTNDRKKANSKEFVKPLENAKGVWFGGGRQWRLVDAYKNTLTENMIGNVLARGGVIGGSSAGATIQGSYLSRGDTKNNQIMMGDHEEGFGFIKNVAIDQHTLARNRHFDMFNILKHRPELLGISIDENTALVVKGNEFKVVGESYVLIYDGTFWSKEGSELKVLPRKNELFYFLRKGDRYDLLNRKVIN
jgi:cyanophycinase